MNNLRVLAFAAVPLSVSDAAWAQNSNMMNGGSWGGGWMGGYGGIWMPVLLVVVVVGVVLMVVKRK
jgi:uncharacterized membrane protein